MRYVYVVEDSTVGIIGVFPNMNSAIKTLKEYSDISLSNNELRELRRTWVLTKENGIIRKCPLYDS